MGRKGLTLGLFFSVFIIFLCVAKAENTEYPTANNNLNPNQAHRSAEYCLRNTSSSCKQHSLTHTGWLNVTHEEGWWFCGNGCAEHTGWVLFCLHHVKRDYRFRNNATVGNLYDTINNGCNSPQGFTGVSIYETDA